jgi:hypothetical protein
MSELSQQLAPFIQAGGNQEASKDGRAADFAKGVVLKGPWETLADGFCEHTRRNARALALAGVPLSLRSVAPKIRIAIGEELQIDEDYKDLLTATVASVEAQIIQVVPVDGSLSTYTTHRYYPLDALKAINSRLIFYCVWERFKGLQSDDLAALKAAGQVWVACHASADFLKAEGVPAEKVRVFPCPYLPSDPLLGLQGRPRVAGRPSFYHIGKWEPRKEQRNILLGFLLAFKPGDAMLMMKTSERAPYFDGYPPSVPAALRECLADDRVKANGWTEETLGKDVFCVTSRLSQQQMTLLHKTSDCYVSLSRGEGFDMPAFDAKLAGNMMLYTPSGGPQDFAHPDDVRIEPKGFIDTHPFYKWTKGSQYLDYDMDDVVAGYRRAAKMIRDGAKTVCDLSHFSALEVGKRMAASIAEVCDLGLKG